MLQRLSVVWALPTQNQCEANLKILRHKLVDPHRLFHMLLVSFWFVQKWGRISKKYVNKHDSTAR